MAKKKGKLKKKVVAKLSKANERIAEGLESLAPLEDVIARPFNSAMRKIAKGLEWSIQAQGLMDPPKPKKKKKKEKEGKEKKTGKKKTGAKKKATKKKKKGG